LNTSSCFSSSRIRSLLFCDSVPPRASWFIPLSNIAAATACNAGAARSWRATAFYTCDCRDDSDNTFLLRERFLRSWLSLPAASTFPAQLRLGLDAVHSQDVCFRAPTSFILSSWTAAWLNDCAANSVLNRS
jgi:hypothetical protein